MLTSYDTTMRLRSLTRTAQRSGTGIGMLASYDASTLLRSLMRTA